MTQTMQPQTTKMADKDIACMLLEDAKICAKTLVGAALEAATPDLRRVFVEEVNIHLEEQDQIYRYMHSKGWYDPFKTPRAMAEQDLQEARKACFS